MENDDKQKSFGSASQSGLSKKTPLQWAKELKTKSYVLTGVIKFTGWTDDQTLTKTEFERKLDEWLKRPIGAGRVK